MVDRFKSDEDRTPVYRIVDETFPLLLNIFSGLVQIGNPSLEVAELIKFICKIFWSSIYVSFSLKILHSFDYTWYFTWLGYYLPS